ncbi:MAG: ammonium transporter [Nitrospirae bacterium]|nr:ammonium transporter [Nitrospirota bacterium]
MNSTAWLLISTVLVMLTLPGVALFYGGMVRKKNVLNTMCLPVFALVLASLEWMLWGDAVTFGHDLPLLGYHAMAGSLALALITGAFVERIRFLFFLILGPVWVALVYSPVAHWLWGGGWLANLGSLDFAGGAVIHITAGVTALVAAIMIGPRKDYGRAEMMPCNLPLSVCGAGFMWVGWFGFSSGSGHWTVATAANAVVAIQVAASAAALAWTAAEWIQRDKPTALGTISGAVTGLVAIAPAAGFVGPLSAIVIGVGAGGLCYMVVNFVKPILGYDDSLDVFGIHGVGGTWGMIATGLFASTAVNPEGSDGLFYGYPYQFFVQVLAVMAVWAFTAGMTALLLKVLQTVMSPRVGDEAEVIGLDMTQHGEKGYTG